MCLRGCCKCPHPLCVCVYAGGGGGGGGRVSVPFLRYIPVQGDSVFPVFLLSWVHM